MYINKYYINSSIKFHINKNNIFNLIFILFFFFFLFYFCLNFFIMNLIIYKNLVTLRNKIYKNREELRNGNGFTEYTSIKLNLNFSKIFSNWLL